MRKFRLLFIFCILFLSFPLFIFATELLPFSPIFTPLPTKPPKGILYYSDKPSNQGAFPPWEDNKEMLEQKKITYLDYLYFDKAPVLKIGSSGEYVLKLKEHLYMLGLYNSVQTNDLYTNDTQKRVDQYRKKINSSYTGNVSQEEQLYLVYVVNNYLNEKLYSTLDYQKHARSADVYSGIKYKFRATIVQQIDETNGKDVSFIVIVNNNQLRPAYLFVPGFYDWNWDISRLLQGDQITAYGVSDGYYKYTTVEGIEKTVPFFNIQHIVLHH